MTTRLRCRYTGEILEGPFVLADDADIDWENNTCPDCGSTDSDECSRSNGESLGRWVHAAREEVCPDCDGNGAEWTTQGEFDCETCDGRGGNQE